MMMARPAYTPQHCKISKIANNTSDTFLAGNRYIKYSNHAEFLKRTIYEDAGMMMNYALPLAVP